MYVCIYILLNFALRVVVALFFLNKKSRPWQNWTRERFKPREQREKRETEKKGKREGERERMNRPPPDKTHENTLAKRVKNDFINMFLLPLLLILVVLGCALPFCCCLWYPNNGVSQRYCSFCNFVECYKENSVFYKFFFINISTISLKVEFLHIVSKCTLQVCYKNANIFM